MTHKARACTQGKVQQNHSVYLFRPYQICCRYRIHFSQHQSTDKIKGSSEMKDNSVRGKVRLVLLCYDIAGKFHYKKVL